jgi:predicted acyl esterase
MAGGSYGGQTQWFAAADAPAALKCIVPVCSPPDAFRNEPILNGCFLLPMGEWMLAMGRRSWQLPNHNWFDAPQGYYDALPLASLPERAGITSPWWDEMMQHPNLDELWRACSYQAAWGQMRVPALNISGWWDMNFPGAWTNFAGMQERGASRWDEVQSFGSGYSSPGWQRAQARAAFGAEGSPVQKASNLRARNEPIEGEGRLVAVSDTGGASAYSFGDRVFHQKFGYGKVTAIEGNKLTVSFDKAGEKKVIDSFVERT